MKQEIRKIARFITCKDIKFGDYLLFQEYVQEDHDGEQYSYKVSRPILAIYLGSFIADMALGFNYVKWLNNRRIVKTATGYDVFQEVDKIHNHIEWSDCIDILGHWTCRPTWKEILKAYRCQNKETTIKANDFEFKN